MRKINRKNAEGLSFQTREIFVGNKNQIQYYTDWSNGRNYARARFEWSDALQDWLHDEWWQLGKDDIKDDDAFARTSKTINRFFGYFSIPRKVW